MGLYSDAELVWGIPVVAFDEDNWDDERDEYPATPFWDPDREDWREFEGDIYVHGYGHYDDPDNKRGILTSKRIESRSADCWKPEPIHGSDLVNEGTNDKLYSKAEDDARVNGLPVSFYGSACWWLVASFG